MKFDVSNYRTSYYVEVENGAMLLDIVRPWKMILGESWKIFREKVWEPCAH